MISVLVPTRKRPQGLRRLIDSIRETSANMPEIVCYVDLDDASYKFTDFSKVSFILGPRIPMSEMWTAVCRHASGDILFMAADDVAFKTKGWDTMVEEAFAGSSDKILMVHGNDCGFGADRFATLPILHRRWVNAVGYFTPPGYTCDWCDNHINDVANAIGRRKYLPFQTEHLHPGLGTAPMDDTYRETRARDARDNNAKRYAERVQERIVDAEKLRKVMSV